ncbi:unnamed protein product [Moneuplotes crassus]|uniref:Uncharacterized protein n=1 Tax=Euplotes crassus TaxID=5936 RepID=A0AAD1YAQ9_EUPCR|nr:unnamed protein product [Moneuplotes crassus]
MKMRKGRVTFTQPLRIKKEAIRAYSKLKLVKIFDLMLCHIKTLPPCTEVHDSHSIQEHDMTLATTLQQKKLIRKTRKQAATSKYYNNSSMADISEITREEPCRSNAEWDKSSKDFTTPVKTRERTKYITNAMFKVVQKPNRKVSMPVKGAEAKTQDVLVKKVPLRHSATRKILPKSRSGSINATPSYKHRIRHSKINQYITSVKKARRKTISSKITAEGDSTKSSSKNFAYKALTVKYMKGKFETMKKVNKFRGVTKTRNTMAMRKTSSNWSIKSTQPPSESNRFRRPNSSTNTRILKRSPSLHRNSSYKMCKEKTRENMIRIYVNKDNWVT